MALDDKSHKSVGLVRDAPGIDDQVTAGQQIGHLARSCSERSNILKHVLVLVCALLSICPHAAAFEDHASETEGQISVSPAEGRRQEGRHIFGIIPNNRTSPALDSYEPLNASEKFRIAARDAADRGTVVLGALFGGLGQLTDSNRSFGQGGAGYGRYFGTSYGDLVVGDYMTEAIFPTVLHQDPRYFRRGRGSGWSRLGYAIGQIFVSHNDSGVTRFNYSEVLGNSAAVAISNAWYADNRTARDAASRLSVQIGVDMVSNVLKEFWPDLERSFARKSRRSASSRQELLP